MNHPYLAYYKEGIHIVQQNQKEYHSVLLPNIEIRDKIFEINEDIYVSHMLFSKYLSTYIYLDLLPKCDVDILFKVSGLSKNQTLLYILANVPYETFNACYGILNEAESKINT